MAELGLIASVIGVAGAGIKLSITLYTFSETVATAADSIKSIAKDVSLTSAVLEELSSNLKHDEQARLYSGTALETAQTVVVDCEAVFKQIDGALIKSMERLGGLAGLGNRKGKGGKVVLSAMEKLKWPFLQPKMQELRANLERLKSTLVLMLNVLTYARKVQTEKQSQPPKDDYQRLLIENLITANQEATRNFQTLLRTIGPGDETGSIMTTSTRKLSVGESTLVAEGAPSDEVQAWSMVTEEANPKRRAPPETNLAERPRGMLSLDEDSGSSQFTISGTSSATETTMACLKRIQQALDQFEASEENLKSARQIAVSIEVYKHILQSDIDARMRRPWEVVSIARREDGNAFRQGRSDEVLHQNQVVFRNSSERSGLQRIPTRMRAGVESGSEDNNPYGFVIQSGGSPNTASGQASGNQRTAALQAEIDDTVGVMRDNINRVSQRGERLDSLQDKTDNLSVSGQAFRRGANRVRKQQGWLSTLGTAWNSLPSAKTAIASTDKFLQAKFEATFYKDSPEEDLPTKLPPPDGTLSSISNPTPPKLQDISPSMEPVKQDYEIEPTTPSLEKASPHYPYIIPDTTLPIAMASNVSTYQPPFSGVAMPPPAMPDMPQHTSPSLTPLESEQSDIDPANGAEIVDTALPPNELVESTRRKCYGPSQGDEVLISYLDSNRPDIAQQAGQTALMPASQSESETEDDLELPSRLADVSTENEADEPSSLDSLLKEWTTLYD